MGTVADERSLTELSIPGTHDTAARFEPLPGIAATQDLTIAEQLDAGVRYLDIRCRHVDNEFLLYHGSIDQNQSYAEFLATANAFLDDNPTEAIIVSIKEEASPSGATQPFDATFASYGTERWYLDATIPRLGDVRGKLVLLRRFDASSPLGLDATAWPDNRTFSIVGPAPMRIEDEYIVSDNDAKWAAITAQLDSVESSSLFLTYTSGYQTMDGLPNIPIVADDINARLDAYIAEHDRLGTVVMDHVTVARVAAIAAAN